MNDTDLFPDRIKLQAEYDRYAGSRELVSRDLALRLEDAMRELPSRISVKVRAKDFVSYYKKYLRLCRQSGCPEPVVITDLIGIRIICPFIEDLGLVEDVVSRVFTVIEVERKGERQTFKEFGYQSIHILIAIPHALREKDGFPGCDVAEIQIRTILQDAWAEVEHELVYKAEFNPFDEPMKRKLAAVNASLSLADIIFQEIRTYQRQLNGELGKRRESFFHKIEESTDALLFAEATDKKAEAAGAGGAVPVLTDSVSIDDLLLSALFAHNKNRFDEAIALYSRIRELQPDNNISSLIYKHRGMANFAQSQYQDAIDDFSRALELDRKSYKAAYYRGVVHSVLKRYSQAIDDFTLSLAISPYQSFCLFRRGQAHYHVGDYPQALSDCEASLALEPQNEAVHRFKSLLQDKLKM